MDMNPLQPVIGGGSDAFVTKINIIPPIIPPKITITNQDITAIVYEAGSN